MKLKGYKWEAAVFGISAAVNILLWLLAWLGFPRGEASAVLHFSVDTGIDFVGTGANIMVLPALGSLFIIFNLVFGLAVRRADRRAALVLWSMLPVLELLLLLAFIFIWRANK